MGCAAPVPLPDAAERQAKLRLAYALNQVLEARELSQADAAKVLGLTQPKISALRHYKLAGFSLEQEQILDSVAIEQATNHLEKLKKLADGKNPKAQYKPLLKTAVSHLESEVLHPLIKRSGLKTVGSSIRAFIAPINDSVLLTYLDESVRCAEQNCVRASIVLAWCAVASKVHTKLLSLGLPALEVAFDKMKQDTGMMFRTFTKTIKLTTTGDIQEVPDANLILLCRFLMWLDDSEYKQLKGALDLRNSCGHPTNYQPDSVKLQAYYADITQLVLLNPRFV